MTCRNLILCRSNHDRIEVGRLACRSLLNRDYDPKLDYHSEAEIKSQVLVDCNVSSRDPGQNVPLVGYKVEGMGEKMY
jgi:hypothetical protein